MKKQLAIALSAVMVLGLAACGSGTTEDTAADTDTAGSVAEEVSVTEEVSAESETAEAGPYTLEDGVYTCSTFSVNVPDGWVLDEAYADETGVKLLKAASEDDYDVYTEPALEISVEEYAYQNKEGDYNLDSLVENDRQFFVDDNPTIEDFTWDIYSGKLLSGESSSYKGCTLKYYDLENWQDGTNNRSRLKVRTWSYSDDDLAELQDIMDSAVFTPGGDEEDASADESGTAESGSDTAEVPEVEGADIVLPEGWYVEDSNTFGVDVTNDKFESGYVSITSTDSYDQTAQEKAEKTSGNYNDAFAVETLEVNGVTYYGFCPTESQAVYFAQTSDGATIVEFSTMFITLDQAMEVLEGITIH